MICTKCNNEIPEGAKFCPSCGASCNTAPEVKPIAEPAPAENKTFCGKCGLELERGAKFCSVCGTPAGGNVTPAPATSNSFGGEEPSAVSLSKDSDNLVAAMNAANAVPTPTNSIPTPVNSVPTPTDSTTPGGFSAGVSGTAPTTAIPTYQAPVNNAPAAAQMQNPFGAYGDAPAAAAVKPIKKNHGKTIGLIAGIAVGVILIAAAAFFFIDRSAFLSLFMGKSGYAAMVEGNSIKAVTEKIDMEAVSNGIKVGSQVAGSALNTYAYTGFSNNDAVDMMYTTSAATSVDPKALIESINTGMMETYGVNSITETFSAKINLSDSAKTMLTDSGATTEELDALIQLINDFNLTCKVNSTENAAQIDVDAKSGKALVNAKIIMNDKGEMYLAFPFVSETALMIKLDSANSSATAEEIKPLELDEKELSRIVENLVKVYLDYYKAGEVTMESGELSAAGLTANGKLITSEIRGEALTNMFASFGETIANDEYLCNAIVEYAKEIGTDLTAESYKEAITDVFTLSSITDGDALVVKTVIKNNGDVLAKSVEAIADDETGLQFIYINNDKQTVGEIFSEGESVLSFDFTATNDTDGSVSVTVEGITVKVDYSGVSTAKFCGKDTPMGTYTLSMVMPADFVENELATKIISGSTLTFGTTIENENTFNSTLALTVGSYGDITINTSLTAQNDSTAISAPANSIDLTAAMNGEEMDEATSKALSEYAETLTAALENVAKQLPAGMSTSFDDIINEISPKASEDDIYNLMTRINDSVDEVLDFSSTYDVDDTKLSEKTEELYNKYMDLYEEIIDTNYDMTPEELRDFHVKANALDEEKEALIKEYEEAAMNKPANSGTSAGLSDASKLDFDSMDIDTIYDYMLEYEERFVAIFANIDNIAEDDNLYTMFNDTYDAYNEATDALENYYESADNGNISLPLLRKVRSTAKTFAESVEAMEKAMGTTNGNI